MNKTGPLRPRGLVGYAGGVIRDALADAQKALHALMADERLLAEIERAGGLLRSCLERGGKIMTCGNGGSMCDAAHFAEELTGRYRSDRPALAALACAEPGHLTCVANDFGFDVVFSRWIEALGKPGDALVLFTTSGNSPNILRAAQAAKARGMTVIGLLGKGGGQVGGTGLCDVSLVLPGGASDRVQELHKVVLHAWCAGLESARVERGGAGGA